MRILSSTLSAGVLTREQQDAVRVYVEAQRRETALTTDALVLSTVLLASREELVAAVRDPYLLPRNDGDRRQDILAQVRAMFPTLPHHPYEVTLEMPGVEVLGRRLIRFLLTGMSEPGQALFPELVDTARLGGSFGEAASQQTVEQAVEQLGGDDIDVRYDGLERLAHELLGGLAIPPLHRWLEERGWSTAEALIVLGAWLHERVGGLDYPRARLALRKMVDGAGKSSYTRP